MPDGPIQKNERGAYMLKINSSFNFPKSFKTFNHKQKNNHQLARNLKIKHIGTILTKKINL